MTRIRPDQPLIPSVLDRLLDYEPDVARDPPKARHHLLRELRASVRRDLEQLLNTRRRASETPPHLKELVPSLAHYGLPDFHTLNLADDVVREELRQSIERLIRTYEPRFKTVRVELLENIEKLDFTLRFRVHALLHAEPAPEPVTFDSALEPTTGQFQLKGGDK